MEEQTKEFCTCKNGRKGRCIYYASSSDRHWCSICKKDLVPESEEEKKKRKKFMIDCHSVDDVILKTFLPKSEWQEYKKKKVG